MITIKRYGGFKDGRLERFGRKVQKGLPISMKEVGVNIRNNAKNIVPVKTGRLQRSIRVMSLQGNSVFVGTSFPYAGYVEFGTIYNRPQPYIRPAMAITSKIMGKKINLSLIKSWEAS